MQLLILIAVFFITGIISVVTGSTSLITVPAMLQLGIEPRLALATNMFALTWMSVGGTMPFLGQNIIDYRRLPLLVCLTIAGSILGALLFLVVPSLALPPIISIAMIAVVIFSLTQRQAGVVPAVAVPSAKAEIAGYAATFFLGIYGGFFSGGYVTLLTAAYVACFRLTLLQAIATTKLVNIFSSLIATLIFGMRGIIDYQLGIILGITIFIGGTIGARVVRHLSDLWLRRIFLATVIVLAVKTLI